MQSSTIQTAAPWSPAPLRAGVREGPWTSTAPAPASPAAGHELDFEECHAWVLKVAAVTCRRRGVWGDDAEEFAALAVMKVVENDFAVLRQFSGRAQLKTYLTTVVVRRFHQWTRERWGRWRHSARAEQLGQDAKDLEALVYRDRYTLGEAIEVMRSAGRTTASDGELRRLFAALPPRVPHRAGTATLAAVADPRPADAAAMAAEVQQRCQAMMEILSGALARLAAEDQILVRERFGEGRSVADIARALQCEQAPLYRRSDRLRAELRRCMEAAGIRRDDVRDVLSLHDD